MDVKHAVVDPVGRAADLVRDLHAEVEKHAGQRAVVALANHLATFPAMGLLDRASLSSALVDWLCLVSTTDPAIAKAACSVLVAAARAQPDLCLPRAMQALAKGLAACSEQTASAVLKPLITGYTNLYRYALRWIAAQLHTGGAGGVAAAKAVWADVTHAQAKILAFLIHDNEAVRTLVLKLMESLVITYSSPTASRAELAAAAHTFAAASAAASAAAAAGAASTVVVPPPPPALGAADEVFILGDLPAGQSVVAVEGADGVRKEGELMLGQLIEAVGDSNKLSTVNLCVVIQSLAALAKARPTNSALLNAVLPPLQRIAARPPEALKAGNRINELLLF
jgi:hypothetical protein